MESSFYKENHSCREFRENFPDYLAGRLTPEGKETFELELHTCEICMRELKEEQELKRTMNTFPFSEEELRDEQALKQIMKNFPFYHGDLKEKEKVLQEQILKTGETSPEKLKKRSYFKQVGAVAALLLLILAGGWLLPEKQSFALEDLVEYHHNCVADKTYANYEYQLEEEMKKVSHAGITKTNMAKHHSFLAGGQCEVDNSRFLHLLYKKDKTIISHFHAKGHLDFRKNSMRYDKKYHFWYGTISGRNIIVTKDKEEDELSFYISEMKLREFKEWVALESSS